MGKDKEEGISDEEHALRSTQMDVEYWWSNFGVIYNVKSGKEVHGPTPNSMQERMFTHYRKCMASGKPCKIMILKPRRKGASTGAQGLIYYHLRSNPELRGMLMGDVDETSDTVMEMFRLYAQKDDYPWDDKSESNFTDEGDQVKKGTLINKSFMKRFTAGSKNAGRSFGGQVAHWDEEAWYPMTGERDPMLSSLQCIDDTSDICLSIRSTTPHGPTGAFYDDWINPKNSWFKIFSAWFEFKDSWTEFDSEKEKEEFLNGLDAEEIDEMARFGLKPEQMNWRRYTIEDKCKGDPDRFRQEYASDDVSCFHLAARPKYSMSSLAEMKKAASQRHDVERGLLVFQEHAQRSQWILDNKGGDIEICEHPKEGCRYLISVDTCSGEDQQMGGRSADPDLHDVGVWRAGYVDYTDSTLKVPRLVARHSSQVDSDLLVEIIAGMCFYYGKCMVVPEVNGESAQHVIKLLLDKRIPIFKRKADPNIMRKTLNERIEAYGWRTTTPTRKWIVDALVKPVREKEVELSFQDVYYQFERFMTNAKGKAEALPGEKDDAVLQCCIGHANLQLATEYSTLRRPKRIKDDLPAGFKIVNA